MNKSWDNLAYCHHTLCIYIVYGAKNARLPLTHFVLKQCTNDTNEEKCAARCDGVIWSCALVDEAGWILTREGRTIEEGEDPVTEHLATLHPAAMAALLKANVFQLSWIHDYQGVCFPPKDEKLNAASVRLFMFFFITMVRH